MYEIISLPKLIVVDSRGRTITRTGIDELNEHEIDVLVTWFDSNKNT